LSSVPYKYLYFVRIRCTRYCSIVTVIATKRCTTLRSARCMHATKCRSDREFESTGEANKFTAFLISLSDLRAIVFWLSCLELYSIARRLYSGAADK